MGKLRNVRFEWYVLNEDRYCSDNTEGKIRPWNIFNNHRVNEDTKRLCDRYKRMHMTFNDFCEALRRIVMYEEWSRCEYEIMVGGLFDKEGDYKKIDCYSQVLPNLRILARYVLDTYYRGDVEIC